MALQELSPGQQGPSQVNPQFCHVSFFYNNHTYL